MKSGVTWTYLSDNTIEVSYRLLPPSNFDSHKIRFGITIFTIKFKPNEPIQKLHDIVILKDNCYLSKFTIANEAFIKDKTRLYHVDALKSDFKELIQSFNQLPVEKQKILYQTNQSPKLATLF